jgi:hypothetical protein
MATRTPSMLLDEAFARADAGDVVGAACYVKEAVRRTLRTICDEHGCRPNVAKSRQLILALTRANVISRSRGHRLNRLVQICDKASRLFHFRPNRIKRAIEAARSIEQPRVVVCHDEMAAALIGGAV